MDTILLIIIGVLSRLMPHPANVTAVGALAVFSGSRYGTTKALVITVGSMLISDMVLGFHTVMWATYGCFALSVLLANLYLRKQSVPRIVGVTLASSILFYLVTNFAVWVVPGSMYPRTLTGLLESYIMALPFFRNSLLGDFSYSAIFFGGYALVKQFVQLHEKSRL
ncbi:MAG: hypothetical protein NT149_03610 [Candidatus Gottesmanbacteria bacterium]|nr:hypothetical protein [Candidatus Gottesmanbacteria bacterium]